MVTDAADRPGYTESAVCVVFGEIRQILGSTNGGDEVNLRQLPESSDRNAHSERNPSAEEVLAVILRY